METRGILNSLLKKELELYCLRLLQLSSTLRTSLFMQNTYVSHYALPIFCKSILFLKEVDIYLWKHTTMVRGGGVSKPDQLASKPLYELPHIHKQDAEKPMRLPWKFTVAITPGLMTPNTEKKFNPVPLSYTLQGLMIKDNLSINNARSIT